MSVEQLAPSTAVADFLDGGHDLLIGDAFVAPADGRTFATIDPTTGRRLCDVAHAGPEDVDRAVRAARMAFATSWASISPADRGLLLARLADLVERDAAELAEVEAIDNGKPVRMARAVDLPLAVAHLRYYAGWPTKIEGETIPTSGPPTFVYTRKEPVGVCAQIVPWNFPLYTAVQKIAPALAAGNTVVLKPAEQTPLSAGWLARLVLEAGFPPGVFNLLTGPGDSGAALVAHDDVDKIAFTGSTAVGREIGASAGRSLKRITLELGGKSPNIVLPDADVESVVSGSYQAMYHNAGQVCQAGSRLFVHRTQFDDVVAGLARRAADARVGPSLDEKTQIGPVVSRAQFDRVQGYLRSGLDAGAELVTGELQSEVDRGYFIQPSLFVGVTDDMAIAREEIFGPVLVALPYDDVDEAVQRANAGEYGLAAYLWTRDVATAHRVAAALQAGSVFVNTPTLSDPAVPFGGYKSSGFGREGGRANLDAYLELKTVWTSLA